jgi:hypothetical protein
VRCESPPRSIKLPVLRSHWRKTVDGSATRTRLLNRIAALPACRKVAVLGAAGGIGQPLSLLLKMNRMISQLALYDIANVAGVAADLSHCNTNTKVHTTAHACMLNRACQSDSRSRIAAKLLAAAKHCPQLSPCMTSPSTANIRPALPCPSHHKLCTPVPSELASQQPSLHTLPPCSA